MSSKTYAMPDNEGYVTLGDNEVITLEDEFGDTAIFSSAEDLLTFLDLVLSGEVTPEVS